MEPITNQDIETLIRAGEERPDLDYKDDIDVAGDKKCKAEIAKDVIAMANSAGGFIIAGVGQSTSGFEWHGMSETTLKAFDSTPLNDFIRNYCAPPINCTTRKVKIDGKVYGVIVVPEFGDQPHIVIKDYTGVLARGDLLVRTASNNSQRAGPDELRRLIDTAVTRRQGVLTDMLQAALHAARPVLVGATASNVTTPDVPFDRSSYAHKYKGFRVMTMAPQDNHFVVRPMQLRPAREAAVIKGCDGSFDFPEMDFCAAAERRLPVGVAYEQGVDFCLSFAFFGTRGEVFYAEGMWEDRHWPPEDTGRIGFFLTFLRILGMTFFAQRYYAALKYTGLVWLRFSQESSLPRSVFMDSSEHTPFHRSYMNDMAVPVTVERPIGVSMQEEELEKVATEMMLEFFWYFGLEFDEARISKLLEHAKTRIRIARC